MCFNKKCVYLQEKKIFNKMVYNKHIDKTEDALCELREVYCSNEVDRFIDGLESGRINSEEKDIKFTNFIRTSDGQLDNWRRYLCDYPLRHIDWSCM